MKKLRALVFGLIAGIILLTSNDTKAAVGAIVAAPVVVTTGLIIAGTGTVGTAASVFAYNGTDDQSASLGYFFLALIAGAVAVLGIIVLDEEQAMSYAEISKKEGLKIGLTNEEIHSYNSEIDQVNALASYVDTQMADLKKPTTEDAKVVWEEVSQAVSPETFSAMQKITAKIYAK